MLQKKTLKKLINSLIKFQVMMQIISFFFFFTVKIYFRLKVGGRFLIIQILSSTSNKQN